MFSWRSAWWGLSDHVSDRATGTGGGQQQDEDNQARVTRSMWSNVGPAATGRLFRIAHVGEGSGVGRLVDISERSGTAVWRNCHKAFLPRALIRVKMLAMRVNATGPVGFSKELNCPRRWLWIGCG